MGTVEKKPARLAATGAWEYASAPESREIVAFAERYGLFIGGEEVAPRSRTWFPTVSPANRGAAGRGRAGRRRRTSRSPSAPHARHSRRGAAGVRRERAKVLFRIARILQERARELAVAESLDGGKPIKESRDVDLPLAAAHFFYYAGWADKLEYAFPGRKPRPLGVAGADRPLELPAADAGLEDRAGARVRQHRRAQAGRDDAADRAPLRRRLPAGAGAAGRRQHRHRRRLDRRAPRAGTRGSTRSRSPARPRSARRSSGELAGRDIPLTLELGGKAANIVFDDCALDQAVEGIVNGIYFNQGHVCCAGSRLLVQESIHDQLVRKLKRRMATLRVGDPLDKNTDVGAINSKAQLDRIARARRRAATDEGAEIYQPPCRLPEKGWWFAPTVFTGVAQSHRIAQEEIFGPVLSVLTFRTPDEAVEKANNTMYGLSAGIWTEKGSRILWMADRLRAGRRLGQHVQPLRPGLAVRRLQGVGVRPRGRPTRARGVPEVRA